ncbi:Ribosomal protein S18 acetylase RimI [Promicromonospora umidemergens]|uniref:GNAT family N-acetyltransferase n=1 Tax=Promicromonospora umidemergens TaxID=629679 RepID=A0ABP8XUL8_9MICO|nr:GNAT family N-acetyltransferase [Promicromonospora umidemergens]MCP2285188.1 Ribosomal protein S18 acetylase RimI [Promicromonospora umidemergens]
MSEPLVRPAVLDDAEAIAVVHHTSWVQTYSDLLPVAHWESDTVDGRAQRWHERLSEEAPGNLSVAVVDKQVVGFAKAGATRRKSGVPLPVRSDELLALYVLSERHGTGIGALLLGAVLPPTAPAELWVADANPRARRFYEKHGFLPDGARFIDDLNFALIRMVR